MLFILVLLIPRVLAESDCPCSLTCPDLFIDCPPGATNPPEYCNQSIVACPDGQEQSLWKLPESDGCTCPSGYQGFQCGLNTIDMCNNITNPGLIYDAGFLNYAVTKQAECQVNYDPIIASQISFIHHRIDITIDKAKDTGDLTVTGRFVLYSRLKVGQQCGAMTKVFACDIANCVGYVTTDSDPNKYIKYECPKSTCTPCDLGSSCTTWQGFLKFTEGQPFIFYFGKADPTTATATGGLQVSVNGASFLMGLSCRAGQCVDQIVQQLYVPPKKEQKAIEATGAIIGVLTIAALILGGLGIWCGRRIPRKGELTEHLLVEREISKDSPPTVDDGPNLAAIPLDSIEPILTNSRKSSQAVEDMELEGKQQGSSSSYLDDSNLEEDIEEGTEKKKPGCGLVFQDIEYVINLPNKSQRKVISGISGLVQPGEYVGIIGPSGAGKSTLLNAIAGYDHRLAGKLDGKINFYGGVRGNRREVVSFVLQEDTLVPTDTVREALTFSARLRSSPDTTEIQIHKTVQDVMKELGLDDIADSMIGDPSFGGISGGERRRVQIGVELVTKPGLLLLDEPTSGLDSQKVGSLLTLLKTISRQNSPCLLTIHQMSARHFQQFDKIILITKQGELGYFGSPRDSLSFLKSINLPLPKQENPADYLLLLATQPKTSKVLASNFASSTNGKTFLAEVAQAQTDRGKLLDDAGTVKPPLSRPARSGFAQFRFLVLRSLKYVARAPTTVYTTLTLAVIMSIILGAVFYQVDNGIPGTQNRAGVLFFMVIYWSLTSLTALGMFITHRSVFEKELAAGYYSASIYFWAQVTSDFLSLRILPPLTFGLICYFMIGLQPVYDIFLLFLFVLVLIHVVAATWCILVSSATSTIAQAEICAVILLVFAMVFGGNFLNNTTDNPLLNLRWISFVQYAYESMFVNEFHGLALVLNPIGLPVTQITGDVIILNFGMDYSRRFFDVGILIVWGVVFLLFAFIILLWKSRLSKIQRGPLDR